HGGFAACPDGGGPGRRHRLGVDVARVESGGRPAAHRLSLSGPGDPGSAEGHLGARPVTAMTSRWIVLLLMLAGCASQTRGTAVTACPNASTPGATGCPTLDVPTESTPSESLA